MTELDSLTGFITSNMPPRAMQAFQSSMDDCELVPSFKAMGLNQLRVGVMRYSAVLSWDDYPYRVCPPSRLYALLLVWIRRHANDLHSELNLAAPAVDPEFIDEKTSMIQIAVPVADAIIIRESEQGVIPMDGKFWDVVYPEIWTAEAADIVTARGTD